MVDSLWLVAISVWLLAIPPQAEQTKSCHSDLARLRHKQTEIGALTTKAISLGRQYADFALIPRQSATELIDGLRQTAVDQSRV